jgi:hypothetical protein
VAGRQSRDRDEDEDEVLNLDRLVCSDQSALHVVPRPVDGSKNHRTAKRTRSSQEGGIMCTHTISVLVTGFVLALTNILPGPAQAQSDSARPAVQDLSSKPIGKVVNATGTVTIERASTIVVQANLAGQAGQMKVGDLVYQGDVVQTGADGQLGINFTDGSSFNLSSSARMALNEFVYDPNGKSNSTLFNLTKGTFTFVAGNVAKTGEMKIDTPVATLGIRGTTPRVEISDDGTVKFSTLIEEGKSKLVKKPGAATTQQPEQKAPPKFNLNICRGC